MVHGTARHPDDLVLGRLEHGSARELPFELPREDGPLPLRAIYHLVPADHSGAGAITPTTPDARRLLASTFVLSVRTPQRLRNQLEVCADLARTASTFEAAVNVDAGSAELAEAIMDHAGEREGATA